MDRRNLPAWSPRQQVDAAYDVRDQKEAFPPRQRLRPPDGAPNVLVILIDDMGFGAPAAFGGPCRMPVAEQLARDGVRYSRFHTAALCSPTRAALMTGRNHHSVGMGAVTEIATSSPGYDGMRGPEAGTLAETLKYNGYATGAFGKWHQTPPWEQTAAGPFDRWPTSEGFEKFYGIMAGEANQFTPTLIDGTTFIDPPATEEEGYHLSEDLVAQARDWISKVRTFDRSKPWFTYLSFGATHAPFHLPRELRENNPYRGAFAHGWDEERERILARQRELGVVAHDTELAPWRGDAPHWTDLDDTERAVAERLMETYAAFADHTDEQVGVLIDFLRATGELDNTLIFYILGDNGASAEGGLGGTLNEMAIFNGFPETAERIHARLDEIGGPRSYPHYPVGWALALDTPYQWAKQVASHYGGTRNGLIVHWPDGMRAGGEVRHQWHHVIDVAPTILEAVGLPHPETINGVPQSDLHGTSMLYSFDDADAPERHTTQYFEMLGNRGIYHEGWTACAQHRVPWNPRRDENATFEGDVWELYDTRTDWSQARDVAAEHPEKLAELRALFEAEARKYDVLPLDDRMVERSNAAVAGRRRLDSAQEVVLTPAHGFLRQDGVPNIKNSSFRVSIDLETDGASSGVLVAQGGRFGGWSIYLDRGRPSFAYNYVDAQRYSVTSAVPMPAGRRSLELVFDYDGGGLGQGGTARLVCDEQEIAVGRVEKTAPFTFSADETLNVGIDRGSPVTDAYAPGRANRYTGTLHTVHIRLGDDSQPTTVQQKMQTALSLQ